jgi:DNA-binding protein YbaB
MSRGLGLGDIVKQAQELQERLSKVQEEAASRTVDASAGGGMVKVT